MNLVFTHYIYCKHKQTACNVTRRILKRETEIKSEIRHRAKISLPNSSTSKNGSWTNPCWVHVLDNLLVNQKQQQKNTCQKIAYLSCNKCKQLIRIKNKCKKRGTLWKFYYIFSGVKLESPSSLQPEFIGLWGNCNIWHFLLRIKFRKGKRGLFKKTCQGIKSTEKENLDSPVNIEILKQLFIKSNNDRKHKHPQNEPFRLMEPVLTFMPI